MLVNSRLWDESPKGGPCRPFGSRGRALAHEPLRDPFLRATLLFALAVSSSLEASPRSDLAPAPVRVATVQWSYRASSTDFTFVLTAFHPEKDGPSQEPLAIWRIEAAAGESVGDGVRRIRVIHPVGSEATPAVAYRLDALTTGGARYRLAASVSRHQPSGVRAVLLGNLAAPKAGPRLASAPDAMPATLDVVEAVSGDCARPLAFAPPRGNGSRFTSHMGTAPETVDLRPPAPSHRVDVHSLHAIASARGGDAYAEERLPPPRRPA